MQRAVAMMQPKCMAFMTRAGCDNLFVGHPQDLLQLQMISWACMTSSVEQHGKLRHAWLGVSLDVRRAGLEHLGHITCSCVMPCQVLACTTCRQVHLMFLCVSLSVSPLKSIYIYIYMSLSLSLFLYSLYSLSLFLSVSVLLFGLSLSLSRRTSPHTHMSLVGQVSLHAFPSSSCSP